MRTKRGPAPKLKLLPWIAFQHDHHLMVFRPRGVMDETRVEETVAVLEEAEKQSNEPFNRYSDLSKIDAFDLRFQFIFRISLHRRLFYAKFPPVKSAFYVTNPATARVVRTHVLLTDHSPLRARMFREATLAANWLGVPVEDLEIAP